MRITTPHIDAAGPFTTEARNAIGAAPGALELTIVDEHDRAVFRVTGTRVELTALGGAILGAAQVA